MFEPGDADRFFGRYDLIIAAWRMLAERRFPAVAGLSGSGRSSLLRAGLMPMLRQRAAGHVAAIRIFAPGGRPGRRAGLADPSA
ncbi:hypothetical protein [Streptomyces sp. AGS-58]|uniref:nSTAND1 domain-containing NTPase n=1 Tax=unclassified Streptomyces TaxID=2593676 RepID=UPI0035A297D0